MMGDIVPDGEEEGIGLHMKNYLDVKFFLLLFFEVIIDVIQGFLLKVLHPLFVCSGVVYVQVLLFEVDAFSIGFFGVNGQLPKTIYSGDP
jgi:hypothetical protein